MDKQVVIVLSNHGWSQAKIARRFKVSRTRIFYIVTQIKRLGSKETRCEICGTKVYKQQHVKVEGTGPFLVCDGCKEELGY